MKNIAQMFEGPAHNLVWKNRYNEIIDEVYNGYLVHTISGVENGFDKIKGYLDKCLVEFDGEYEHFNNPSFQYGYRPHTQEEFNNKIKTDDVFAKKWGVKITERELSFKERQNYGIDILGYESLLDYGHSQNDDDIILELLNEWNVPTKVITLEYKNEIVEYYE